MKARVADFTYDSVVDGPGLRTVVWFSGCKHKCPDCHNKQLWDFNTGYDIEVKDLADRLKDSKRLTFSGGDPMFQLEALDELVGLLDPNKDIWIYTGYTLQNIDVKIADTKYLKDRNFTIKCGPFVKSLMSRNCLYRGSSNQRIYKYSNGEYVDISDGVDRGE